MFLTLKGGSVAEREIERWITVNGKHIPLYDGESSQDAYNRAIARLNEDKKQSDIERNKAQADILNGKKSSKETATERTQAEHKAVIKELDKPQYGDGTYDIKTKKTVDFQKGYQVTFCQIGDKYSDADYAKKVNECLKFSSDGKTYAGKFESTPEISFHCNSKEQAIAYAKANNQISIWDWEKGDQIFTGGTGKRGE